MAVEQKLTAELLEIYLKRKKAAWLCIPRLTFSPFSIVSSIFLSPESIFLLVFTAKLRIVTLLFIICLHEPSFFLHPSLTRLTTLLPHTKSQDVESLLFPHESPPSCAHPSFSSVPQTNIFLFFISWSTVTSRALLSLSISVDESPTTNSPWVPHSQEKEILFSTVSELYMMCELFYIFRRGVR